MFRTKGNLSESGENVNDWDIMIHAFFGGGDTIARSGIALEGVWGVGTPSDPFSFQDLIESLSYTP